MHTIIIFNTIIVTKLEMININITNVKVIFEYLFTKLHHVLRLQFQLNFLNRNTINTNLKNIYFTQNINIL